METNNLSRTRAAIVCLSSSIFILAGTARGQTLEVLHVFHDSDGSGPRCALVQGTDGNFYGTTIVGGDLSLNFGGGCGTVFKMTPGGAVTTIALFNNTNGLRPECGLVQGGDGNFYGTTREGGKFGYGTVFRITTNGTLTTLVSFDNTNGSGPQAALVQGSDSNLYGTTGYGGNLSLNGGIGYGTVFKVTTNGALASLAAFNQDDGSYPVYPTGPLVPGSDGGFYGTTPSGGAYNCGTVFKVASTGALTTLLSFSTNNGPPWGGLVQANDGNFYGTAGEGAFGWGSLFRLTPAGLFTTLFSFDSNYGSVGSIIQADDGSFYGTAYGHPGGPAPGIVFKMKPDGTWMALVSFDGTDASFSGVATLVQGTDGNLYGTTEFGGDLSFLNGYGIGTIFRIVMPPPQPTLTIAPGGNLLVLSWPTNAAGFALQNSPDLTNWNNSTTPPVIVGTQNTITNALSGSFQFYRLKK